jgi:hypothetical protein
MRQSVLLKHSKLGGGVLLLAANNLPGTGETILEKTKGFFRSISYNKLGTHVKDLHILHVLGNLARRDVTKEDLAPVTSDPGWCLFLLWRHDGVCVGCEW